MWGRGLCLIVLAACESSPASSTDAAIDVAPPNDGRYHVDDGTPTRQPCTNTFGHALTATATFGRLDGYLVAIVPPGGSACNADSSHVHLQIKMSGAIYDVAVTVSDAMTGVDDVHTTKREIASPVSLPWAEGWHTGLRDDYVSLGLHAADLPLVTKAELVPMLQSDLATANHISVYATTYGSDGIHLVHRNGNGKDGVIVTDPLSSPAQVRFFSFSDQSF